MIFKHCLRKKNGMYGDCWDGRRGVAFLGFGYLYQDVWIYKPFY